MGPLWWIDRISPAALPVYVSVYCFADILGAGPPAHSAAVTLSALAIEKGCEIVLNTGGAFGEPSNGYFKLVVIKVPKKVKGELFTLTLAGCIHEIDESAPDVFCGIYEFEQSIVWLSHNVDSLGNQYETYRGTTRHLTPDGETTTTDLIYRPRRFAGDEYHSLIHEEHMSYYVGGILYNTGLPCSGPPPNKIEYLPFDVQVVINPIKDHVVSDPGVAFFFDPAQAVKKIGAGDYEGKRTSVWQIFVSNRAAAGAPSGLIDGTIGFSMQTDQFSVVRKEKIIEVYPSTPITYGAGGTYSPGFRLNNFVKFPPPPNLYSAAWAGGYHGEFPETILYAGSPPTPVSFDPFLYPEH